MTKPCSRLAQTSQRSPSVQPDLWGQLQGRREDRRAEGREKKVTYCFLTHLVTYKVGLFAWFMEIFNIFKDSKKDFDEF